MNYVESFDLVGTPVFQIPCIKVNGAPTATTEGAEGCLAMDITSENHDLYKCVDATDNVYTWVRLTREINALKGTASGVVVALNDVSPVEHEVECVVRSKNWIPYPFSAADGTYAGVNITTENGKITLNGTAEKNYAFSLFTGVSLLPNTQYTLHGLTGIETGNEIQLFVAELDGTSIGTYVASLWTDVSKTFTTSNDASKKYTGRVYFKEGVTFENVTIQPMLEVGTEATDWTPYVAPVGVTLSKYGKNLSPITTKTLTTDSEVNYASTDIVYLPAGKYIFSTKFKQAGELNKVGIAARDMDYKNLGGANLVSDDESGTLSYAFEVPIAQQCRLQFWGTYGSANVPTSMVTSIFSDIQVEVDNGSGAATEFEEPIKVEYLSKAGGTIAGVTSLAPNMTIMTDTDGVVIDVNYNRDINKAFEEMYNAIISLGGNI